MTPVKNTAKNRILSYFNENRNTPIHTRELAVIGGIIHYSRRVRELRYEGYPIVYVGNGIYLFATNKRKSTQVLNSLRSNN